jgi:hypothetical protein
MAEVATVAAVDEINYLNLIDSCTETERLTAEQRSAVSLCIGHYSAFDPSVPEPVRRHGEMDQSEKPVIYAGEAPTRPVRLETCFGGSKSVVLLDPSREDFRANLCSHAHSSSHDL